MPWDGTQWMQHPSGLILPLVMIAMTVWNAFHQPRLDTVARRFPAPPITRSAGEFSEFTYIVVRVCSSLPPAGTSGSG